MGRLTIGSDPEFGFINEAGDQVYATKFINNPVEYGVGLDHHTHIAEVRSRPSGCPLRHVQAIKYLLNRDIKIPSNIKVVAGTFCGQDPLGGHIHFKFPEKYENISFYSEATTALDSLLGVPVLCLEDSAEASQRRTDKFHAVNGNEGVNGPYGFWGDFRETDHGFEWRTLPSWLVSESFAKQILCTAYVVVHDFMVNHKIHINFSDSYSKFNNGDKLLATTSLKKIFETIRSMELYPIYAIQIASLFGLLKAFGGNKTWNCKENIIPKWNRR